ncbi:hypothetical protein JX266_000539 [Neoarthrinium moseri]|nr:hypothetical protein JX266_000539 [Neoarthrinium moseri]
MGGDSSHTLNFVSADGYAQPGAANEKRAVSLPPGNELSCGDCEVRIGSFVTGGFWANVDNLAHSRVRREVF